MVLFPSRGSSGSLRVWFSARIFSFSPISLCLRLYDDDVMFSLLSSSPCLSGTFPEINEILILKRVARSCIFTLHLYPPHGGEWMDLKTLFHQEPLWNRNEVHMRKTFVCFFSCLSVTFGKMAPVSQRHHRNCCSPCYLEEKLPTYCFFYNNWSLGLRPGGGGVGGERI